MQKAEYKEFGAPDQVLELVASDTPSPGAGEVQISVLRCPINPSDLLQVAGVYGVRPPLPAIAGNEGIGRVTQTGAGVPEALSGQVVLLPAGSGTWQTAITCPAEGLVPLPEVDLDQLAMVTVNPPTAYLMLEEFVTLEPGDWIIQTAANSAVGGYVIQLAKARGIRTVNVVRRAEVADDLKALGADVVVVDGPDLAKRVAEATEGAKIRLGLDAVGGGAFERVAATLAKGATLVSYGAMSMEPVALPVQSMIFNDLRIRGFWLAPWFGRASAERKAEVFGALVGMIAQGKLVAKVAGVYDLSDLGKAVAHAAQEGRDGKVLIAPGGV